MLSGKNRILVISILLVVSIVGVLVAGTTGKITGRVIDKETNEPLIGANVIVIGTSMGAATDVDGYYVILNVPPGQRSISASMVGYALTTINNVQVLIDQTATVDIYLISEAVKADEVVVVAERNVVKKDVSTSVVALQPEEIQSLPVASVNDIVGLQAGVEDGFVIRGGSSDQLLFQIDGVTLRDPRNNRPISTVALSSIQEISIERSGFNAEYGQVRSGIINIVEKAGDVAHYFGSATLKYSPPQQKFFGMSVFDPNSMWNKPYLDTAVCWTGTTNGAWNKYVQRQYPQFEGWNSISEKLLQDNDPTNDLSPEGCKRLWEWQHRRRPTKSPDYNIDGSFGGPVPIVSKSLGNLRFFVSYILEREMLLIPLSRDDYKDYNWSIKLNSDINSKTNLMVTATTGKSYNVAMNADDRQYNSPIWGTNGVQFWDPTAYVRTPFQIAMITNEQRPCRIYDDSWYSEAQVSHFTLASKVTTCLSASTFYEVGLEYVNRDYLTGPIHSRNLTQSYEIAPGYFVDEAPFGYSPDPITGIGDSRMFFGGHSATIRDSSKLNSFVLKTNLTSQVNRENLIKTGIEFSYYDINMNYALVNPAFGGNNIVKEQWNPYRFSAYVQDKIEAYGFIANIGVRMDISNPNTEWADVDPFDNTYFSSNYNTDTKYPMKKADVDISFSPRLGISHPITENSKLYFNYGHFKEMPAYEEVFRIGRGSSNTMLNYGDPNLVQAKTVSYELGYDHSLFGSCLIQVAAFYNDITDQLGYTQYVSDKQHVGYFKANNNSYSDIRGIEFTFRKTEGNWVRGFANYTYQVVTSGNFGSLTINDNPSEQKNIDRNTPNLYQQRPIPLPRANGSITFLTPKDFGPQFHEISPFGDWSLNILAEWKAGQWINYNPNQIQELGTIIPNVQVKDYYNIDLRINKFLEFKSFTVTLFMETRNLLNTKMLSGKSFYDTYDQTYYFQSLHLPSSRAYNNISGEDRIGEVRKEGVEYQPIEQSGNVFGITNPKVNADPKVIYYDLSTKRYMNYIIDKLNPANNRWEPVESSRMQKILDDKAYIDMPNNSTFDFLNPRQYYYGISISVKL
jgi:outer membrane receptor protein involved in Fe transport